MLVLGFAVVSIAGAAVRESDLPSGETPGPAKIRRSRIATVVAALVVVGILFIGGAWWKSDAARFAARVYSPPPLDAMLDEGGHLVLHQGPVKISAGNPRRPADVINFDNLIPDHAHLMHFFMIRTPEMDSFWHLHPTPEGGGAFADDLPPIPPGHYQLYADVVLSSGFPVTMIGQLDVHSFTGKPLAGDDSGIIASPIDSDADDTTTDSFPDGGRMIWERGPRPLKANEALLFRFHVQDGEGKPARDLEPYMGMAAHAEIIRSDGSVFAHVHPDGSVAMAALGLAQMQTPGNPQMAGMAGMNMANMPSMASAAQPISADISFPYGFPKPGQYRLFVQVKRAGRIETAVFQAKVE